MSRATASAKKPAAPPVAEPSGIDHAMRLRDRVMEMSVEALAFTPPSRSENLARQFLSRADTAEEDAGTAERIALALAFAADIAIFAASSSGATAIDRYLRSRPPGDKTEIQAANALRRARFRIVQIDRCEAPDIFQATDIATDEGIRLFQSGVGPAFVGQTVATRLCPLEGGGFIATGPAIPVDGECLAVARGFIRPSAKGLINPERCAEAIYRHVIRHGNLAGDLLNLLTEAVEELDAFPYGPESGPIAALAHRWAELGNGVEPTPEDLATARALAGAHNLLDALAMAEIAAEYDLPLLGAAFDRILVIQIETMQRRTAVTTRAVSPDDVARTIEAAIREGKLLPSARTRFAELRRRAGAVRESSKGGADLDRLLQIIQGLRAKTVDQGCTEAEAIAAAAKVAELLDRYGLSLSDVELRRQSCESVGIETRRRRSGPLDHTIGAIAAFFDCRCWSEKTEAETLRHVFFGLPGDVEAAQYLYELIEKTFETETSVFQNGNFYRKLHSSQRRQGTSSFQLGLSRGIMVKLDTLRREREAAMHRSSGRDLMVVKASVVDEELEKLGITLKSKAIGGKKYVLTDAYEAGQEAGERFEYRAGIGR